MKSFTPTWHPTRAENYFTLYNNLNKTNNILFYDTNNDTLSIPKHFYYNRISSANNFQLYKIETNSNSDNPYFIKNSTTSDTPFSGTSGEFYINKIAPNTPNGSPTIDLYANGVIIKTNASISPNYDYDVDSPSSVRGITVNYSISPNNFPNSSNIGVKWEGEGDPVFYPDTFYDERGNEYQYSYEGDSIVFTNNWSNDRIFSDIRNVSSYRTFDTKITESKLKTLEEIPTIYCDWTVLWGYECTDYRDSGCDPVECDPVECDPVECDPVECNPVGGEPEWERDKVYDGTIYYVGSEPIPVYDYPGGEQIASLEKNTSYTGYYTWNGWIEMADGWVHP